MKVKNEEILRNQFAVQLKNTNNHYYLFLYVVEQFSRVA